MVAKTDVMATLRCGDWRFPGFDAATSGPALLLRQPLGPIKVLNPTPALGCQNMLKKWAEK